MLSVIMLLVIAVIVLSDIMQRANILSAIMLNVIMLNVMSKFSKNLLGSLYVVQAHGVCVISRAFRHISWNIYRM